MGAESCREYLSDYIQCQDICLPHRLPLLFFVSNWFQCSKILLWCACTMQVMAAVCAALGSTSLVLRDTGLMLARDLAAAVLPSLFLPTLPLLLPMLLACAAEQEAREIVLAADEALEALLLRAPPQSCLGVLAPRLPAIGDSLSTDRQQGAELHATIRSLRRVVVHMQPAGLSAHLQPLLLPGLCTTYRSPLTDVRKATVDCLISIWLVSGLLPFG